MSIFTGVNHVGIATNNIPRAIRNWHDRYGIGPWDVYEYGEHNLSVRPLAGENHTSFAMTVALASLPSGFRIELLQPHDEFSPYYASLQKHGGRDHVHHLRMELGDFGITDQHLTDLGLDTAMDAAFASADPRREWFRAKYFDTEDELGVTLEVCHMPEGFAMPERAYRYP